MSGTPSAPLRAAIVGCGNVALNDHAPAYLALPDAYRAVALVDPSPERRAILADLLGLDVSAGFASLEDALVAMPIDVVDICTPPALHRRLVEAAAAAGCDVLCEKPLATVPADADAIADAVSASGIRFGMVHNYQWFPEVLAIRELIAAGAIGRLQVVLIDSLGVDDNPGAAAYRPGWRHELDAGGGVLMDLIHLVYLAEILLGGPIERVSATVDVVNEGASVESIALCRFDTDERGSALVNVGWGVGPGGMRASGTEGRIEVRYRDGGTGPWSPIEAASLVQRGREPRPITIPSGRETHRAVLEDFADAVSVGRSPAADVSAGVRAVMATVAAYESAATGATVRVPLERDDPAYRSGVGGVSQLDLPEWSPIRRRGLFGQSAGR